MKVISANEIGKIIHDGDMVGISGSGGCGSPETLLSALRNYFETTGHPKGIGVTCGITPGDKTTNYVGFNHLAVPGLVDLAICSHLGRGKLFGQAVAQNQFAAYTIPLGVYGHLLRAIAGKKIGVLTTVGLNTYCDPRLEGCRANEKCTKDIVELVNIDGQEQLLYRSFPIQVALIKASYADVDGNVSLIHEPVIGEQKELASAVANSGGIVICEVDEILPRNKILPKNVDIFKKLVDYIVISKKDYSLGDYNFPIFKPELIGETIVEPEEIAPMPLNERKICGRRACMELKADDIVNLGIGMPDSVGVIAAEENFSKKIYISIETGVFGGVPVYWSLFGAAINPIALYSTCDIFDLYDGGIIDVAVLGLAEVDVFGNVNVSKINSRSTGPGGFINITQSSKKVIFIGTFTAHGLKVEIKDQKIKILKEGTIKKFKKNVQQITFASQYAVKTNQNILYITERAVFQINSDGFLELIEIAPGIDLENDIIKQMEFRPKIAKDLKLMDARLFQEEKLHLEKYFQYGAHQDIFE